MTDFNHGLTGSEKTLLLAIYALHYFNDFASQQILKSMNFEYTEGVAMLQSYNLIILDDDDIPDLTPAGIELAKNLTREIQQSLIKKPLTKKSYPWHKKEEV